MRHLTFRRFLLALLLGVVGAAYGTSGTASADPVNVFGVCNPGSPCTVTDLQVAWSPHSGATLRAASASGTLTASGGTLTVSGVAGRLGPIGSVDGAGWVTIDSSGRVSSYLLNLTVPGSSGATVTGTVAADGSPGAFTLSGMSMMVGGVPTPVEGAMTPTAGPAWNVTLTSTSTWNGLPNFEYLGSADELTLVWTAISADYRPQYINASLGGVHLQNWTYGVHLESGVTSFPLYSGKVVFDSIGLSVDVSGELVVANGTITVSGAAATVYGGAQGSLTGTVVLDLVNKTITLDADLLASAQLGLGANGNLTLDGGAHLAAFADLTALGSARLDVTGHLNANLNGSLDLDADVVASLTLADLHVGVTGNANGSVAGTAIDVTAAATLDVDFGTMATTAHLVASGSVEFDGGTTSVSVSGLTVDASGTLGSMTGWTIALAGSADVTWSGGSIHAEVTGSVSGSVIALAVSGNGTLVFGSTTVNLASVTSTLSLDQSTSVLSVHLAVAGDAQFGSSASLVVHGLTLDGTLNVATNAVDVSGNASADVTWAGGSAHADVQVSFDGAHLLLEVTGNGTAMLGSSTVTLTNLSSAFDLDVATNVLSVDFVVQGGVVFGSGATLTIHDATAGTINLATGVANLSSTGSFDLVFNGGTAHGTAIITYNGSQIHVQVTGNGAAVIGNTSITLANLTTTLDLDTTTNLLSVHLVASGSATFGTAGTLTLTNLAFDGAIDLDDNSGSLALAAHMELVFGSGQATADVTGSLSGSTLSLTLTASGTATFGTTNVTLSNLGTTVSLDLGTKVLTAHFVASGSATFGSAGTLTLSNLSFDGAIDLDDNSGTLNLNAAMVFSFNGGSVTGNVTGTMVGSTISLQLLANGQATFGSTVVSLWGLNSTVSLDLNSNVVTVDLEAAGDVEFGTVGRLTLGNFEVSGAIDLDDNSGSLAVTGVMYLNFGSGTATGNITGSFAGSTLTLTLTANGTATFGSTSVTLSQLGTTVSYDLNSHVVTANFVASGSATFGTAGTLTLTNLSFAGSIDLDDNSGSLALSAHMDLDFGSGHAAADVTGSMTGSTISLTLTANGNATFGTTTVTLDHLGTTITYDLNSHVVSANFVAAGSATFGSAGTLTLTNLSFAGSIDLDDNSGTFALSGHMNLDFGSGHAEADVTGSMTGSTISLTLTANGTATFGDTTVTLGQLGTTITYNLDTHVATLALTVTNLDFAGGDVSVHVPSFTLAGSIDLDDNQLSLAAYGTATVSWGTNNYADATVFIYYSPGELYLEVSGNGVAHLGGTTVTLANVSSTIRLNTVTKVLTVHLEASGSAVWGSGTKVLTVSGITLDAVVDTNAGTGTMALGGAASFVWPGGSASGGLAADAVFGNGTVQLRFLSSAILTLNVTGSPISSGVIGGVLELDTTTNVVNVSLQASGDYNFPNGVGVLENAGIGGWTDLDDLDTTSLTLTAHLVVQIKGMTVASDVSGPYSGGSLVVSLTNGVVAFNTNPSLEPGVPVQASVTGTLTLTETGPTGTLILGGNLPLPGFTLQSLTLGLSGPWNSIDVAITSGGIRYKDLLDGTVTGSVSVSAGSFDLDLVVTPTLVTSGRVKISGSLHIVKGGTNFSLTSSNVEIDMGSHLRVYVDMNLLGPWAPGATLTGDSTIVAVAHMKLGKFELGLPLAGSLIHLELSFDSGGNAQQLKAKVLAAAHLNVLVANATLVVTGAELTYDIPTGNLNATVDLAYLEVRANLILARAGAGAALTNLNVSVTNGVLHMSGTLDFRVYASASIVIAGANAAVQGHLGFTMNGDILSLNGSLGVGAGAGIGLVANIQILGAAGFGGTFDMASGTYSFSGSATFQANGSVLGVIPIGAGGHGEFVVASDLGAYNASLGHGSNMSGPGALLYDGYARYSIGGALIHENKYDKLWFAWNFGGSSQVCGQKWRKNITTLWDWKKIGVLSDGYAGLNCSSLAGGGGGGGLPTTGSTKFRVTEEMTLEGASAATQVPLSGVPARLYYTTTYYEEIAGCNDNNPYDQFSQEYEWYTWWEQNCFIGPITGEVIVSQGVTDSNGYVTLTGTAPGTVSGRIDLPTSGTWEFYSDFTSPPTDGIVQAILTPVGLENTYQFVVRGRGDVTGQVFTDGNVNGVFDGGEAPRAGEAVRLQKSNGSGAWVDVSVKTTDATGTYNFPGTLDGDYRVVVTIPALHVLTTQNQNTVIQVRNGQPFSGPSYGLFNNGGGPVALPDSYTTPYGTTLARNTQATGVMGNDAGAGITAAVTAATTHGVLTLGSTGTFTYVPDSGYFGPDSFSYRITDSLGATADGAASITVSNPTPPGAGTDSALTDFETLLNGGSVLANDTGTGIHVVSNTQPAHGSATVSTSDGTYVYTPAAAFAGTDSFTYTIADVAGQTVTGTVIVTVMPPLAPAAGSNFYQAGNGYTLTRSAPGVLDNDQGTGITVTGWTQGDNGGSVSMSADGSFSYTNDFTFTSGVEVFTYTITDVVGQTATGSVAVQISQIDPPSAANDFANVSYETTYSGSVLGNDSGTGLSIQSNTNPSHGSLSFVIQNGTYSYTPANGFSGTDSFQYTITGSTGGTSTATVTLSVGAPPGPTAQNQSYTGNTNQVISSGAPGVLGGATGTGVAVDTGQTPSNGPWNGNVTVYADGAFTYSPNTNFAGSDSFTFTVVDGFGQTAEATVSITINAPPGPVANGDSYNVAFGGSISIDAAAGLLANDSGPGIYASGPFETDQFGSVSVSSDGSFSYSAPHGSWSGTDSFAYTLHDQLGRTATGYVTLTVAPPAAPTAGDDSGSTAFQTTLSGSGLLANDSGSSISVTGHSSPANGTVSTTAGGGYTYTPVAGFSGSDSFTYTITDIVGQTATATVTVTVGAPPPAQANDDEYYGSPDQLYEEFAPGVLGNDLGAGLSVTSWDFTSQQGGSIFMGADGAFTYSPPSGYQGWDQFTYTITDGLGSTSTATVRIAVGL